MEHISGAVEPTIRVERRGKNRAKAPPARPALIRIGALALVLVVTSLVGYKLGWFDYRHTLEHVSHLRKSHGFASVTIAFVVAFGVGTAVGVPGLPLTVAAGLVFGTLLGTVLSWLGCMIGAVLGYWIARTAGHGVVSRWLQRNKRVNNAISESRDFPGMLTLRLIPVLPISVVNFVGGLARAPFGSYLGATAVGVLPATVVYAYFADSFFEETKGGGNARTSLFVASVLLVAFALAPKVFSRYRAHAARAAKVTAQS